MSLRRHIASAVVLGHIHKHLKCEQHQCNYDQLLEHLAEREGYLVVTGETFSEIGLTEISNET